MQKEKLLYIFTFSFTFENTHIRNNVYVELLSYCGQ